MSITFRFDGKEMRMEPRNHLANVLIVDDEIGPRESLRMILKPHYNIYTAENGTVAIQILKKHEVDVVTMDLKMPGMSGIETLKEIRSIDSDVMVIIITGYGTLQTAIEAIRYGVFDYIAKPFNVPEIMCIIDKSIQRRKLNLMVKEMLNQHPDMNKIEPPPKDYSPPLPLEPKGWVNFNASPDGNFLETQNCLEFSKVLAFTLEEKDPYTSGHSERVCYYADIISKKLALNPKDSNEIRIASYLHDIGKIGISNRFINKKGTLTTTEWAIIKQHTRKSIELLVPLNLSPNILSYIQHHHERFDGTGYPEGLSEDQIPLGARIIAIADAYDSMTSDRPYRKPLSNGEAKNELLKHAGKQFDPQLVNIFLDILKEIEEVFMIKDHTGTHSISY